MCFHALQAAFVAAGIARLALGAREGSLLLGPGWNEAFPAVFAGSQDTATPLAHDLACSTCGYNLRGLAPGARCPECSASIEGSLRAALQRLTAQGAATVANLRAHTMKAVLICAALSAAFALRAAFDDPQRPWWSAGALIVSGALTMALAAWTPRRILAYFAGVQVIVAANVYWFVVDWQGTRFMPSSAVSDLIHINVIALAISGVAWLLVEKRYLLHRLAAVPPASFPFQHAAALLATAGVVGLNAVALGAATLDAPLAASPAIAWLAWGAAVGLVVACGLAGTFSSMPAAIYALAMAAVLRVLATVETPLPTRMALTALALAVFALVTTLAWRRWLRPSGATVAPSPNAWLPTVNSLFVVLATSLAYCVSFMHPLTSWRFLVSLAPLCGAAAAVHFTGHDRRRYWPTASLALVFLAGVVGAWAWTPPGAPAALLQRAVALIAVAAVYAAAASAAPRWLAILRNHAAAITDTVAGIAAVTGVALAYLCFIEISALAAHQAVPIPDYSIALALLGLALLVACCATWALRPSADPLRAPPAFRGAYIYVAEALIGVGALHIRATLPWLFSGLVTQYWPMLVIGLAFAAVGGGEVCARRGLAVISRPLTRTGVLLPFITLAELVVATSRVHFSLVLLCAGVLYAVLAGWRRSARLGTLAMVAFNGSLWYLLGHVPGLGLAEHPQLWFIPPALAVLAAGQLNRRRLTSQQLGLIHYGCLLAIYLSSTADIFLIGVVRAPWLPFVLAALSVAGVLVGFLARIRSFLMLGMGFLCLALFTMIWHAATNLGWTWLWYVAGIALGAAIITVFALFEKKRTELQKWITELRTWAG